MFGRLHTDIFNQPHFLIPGVTMRLRLSRTKDAFNLLSPEANADYISTIKAATRVGCSHASIGSEKCEIFDKKNYVLGGLCLFAFDLTTDGSATQSHFNLIKQGTLRIDLKFCEPLPTTTSLIVYAQFQSLVERPLTQDH
uniref:Uncharacterized protein n=1 Tax=Strigamia maritima TaxID=126957 RepID=T1J0W9_STRMM